LGAYDPLIQPGDEASERNVLGRIAAGRCLIAEPASLSFGAHEKLTPSAFQELTNAVW